MSFSFQDGNAKFTEDARLLGTDTAPPQECTSLALITKENM